MTQDEFASVVSRLFGPACDKAYHRGAADELHALRASLGPKTFYTAAELDRVIHERSEAAIQRAEKQPPAPDSEGHCNLCALNWKFVQKHYTCYSPMERVAVLCEGCWAGMELTDRVIHYVAFREDEHWPLIETAILEGK
jgi:hypothetical protein